MKTEMEEDGGVCIEDTTLSPSPTHGRLMVVAAKALQCATGDALG